MDLGAPAACDAVAVVTGRRGERETRHDKRIEALRMDESETGTPLSVVDDGRKFPELLPRKRGMGLRGMGYRAEGIGGILTVRQGLTDGTQATWDFDAKPKRRKGA